MLSPRLPGQLLPDTDEGGIGQGRRDGEATALLAMLMPPMLTKLGQRTESKSAWPSRLSRSKDGARCGARLVVGEAGSGLSGTRLWFQKPLFCADDGCDWGG